MARPKLPPPNGSMVVINQAEVRKDMDAFDAANAEDRERIAATAMLAVDYGYMGDMHPSALMAIAQQAASRAATAYVELGRALLLLKTRLSHGALMPALEQLGIGQRVAQRYMQIAQKADDPKWRKIIGATGSARKVLEFGVLDTDDLQALADGKDVGGVTLDAADKLSVSELRAAFRDHQLQLVSKDERVAQLGTQIDKLKSKGKWRPSEDSIAQTQEEAAQIEALEESISHLQVLFLAMGNTLLPISQSHTKALRLKGEQALVYLTQKLADIAIECAYDIDMQTQLDETYRVRR